MPSAVDLYKAAIGQTGTAAANYTKLAGGAGISPQAAAMYRAAAAQETARRSQFSNALTELQSPAWAPPTSANAVTNLQQESERKVQEQRARLNAGTDLQRLQQQFTGQIMPQLKGQLGATGQFYGSAGKGAMQNATTNFTNSAFDINQALQRQLDDFTRQRTYASLGLLV
jgi:hypothetical protein